MIGITYHPMWSQHLIYLPLNKSFGKLQEFDMNNAWSVCSLLNNYTFTMISNELSSYKTQPGVLCSTLVSTPSPN